MVNPIIMRIVCFHGDTHAREANGIQGAFNLFKIVLTTRRGRRMHRVAHPLDCGIWMTLLRWPMPFYVCMGSVYLYAAWDKLRRCDTHTKWNPHDRTADLRTRGLGVFLLSDVKLPRCHAVCPELLPRFCTSQCLHVFTSSRMRQGLVVFLGTALRLPDNRPYLKPTYR